MIVVVVFVVIVLMSGFSTLHAYHVIRPERSLSVRKIHNNKNPR